jgi:precorrin-2 dehydrogenase/sirohydrochlorin ferrochelatase
MGYYPIAIDLTGKRALVVGGGEVALRKVEALLESGARVTVVAPEVAPEIERLAESGKIVLRRRNYEAGDLADAVLAIAATDDREVNLRVSEDARGANVLVNVVDDPELCSFIVPATVKRGDLVVSIITGGKSPALARRVREKIEETFGPEYGDLAELLGEVRELARDRIESQPVRERVFEAILDSEVADLLRQGRSADAHVLALEILEGFRVQGSGFTE